FQEALTLAREVGIPRWQAFALRNIAKVHLVRGAPDTAERLLDESLALQRSLPDGAGGRLEAETLTDLGQVRLLSRQAEQAIQLFAEALAVSERTGAR